MGTEGTGYANGDLDSAGRQTGGQYWHESDRPHMDTMSSGASAPGQPRAAATALSTSADGSTSAVGSPSVAGQPGAPATHPAQTLPTVTLAGLASGETPPPSKAQMEQAADHWFYGGGLGRTMATLGTVVAFPPYAFYLLGNAGLSLAGFEQLYITDLLPENPRDAVLGVYDGVTSVPGRMTSAVAGREFSADPPVTNAESESGESRSGDSGSGEPPPAFPVHSPARAAASVAEVQTLGRNAPSHQNQRAHSGPNHSGPNHSGPNHSGPNQGLTSGDGNDVDGCQNQAAGRAAVVGIAAKHSHPDAPGLTRKLVYWLREKNIPFLVETSTVEKLGLHDVNPQQLISRDLLTTECSVIVVLGGDGTLISVCRHPSPKSPTIIGVNLGTLGFLTEITSEELFPTLQAVLEGRANLEQRSLLVGLVRRNGHTLESFTAINDVVVTKQALARIFALSLYVDSQLAAVVRGDGIIVATPSGSTAYSMAAGGSIVHPGVNAVLVTPICPHSLSSRPLVLPSGSNVRLQIASDTTPDHVYLTIDGQLGMALESSDEIEITTSEHYVQFAKSPSKTYFEVLATSLKWATR